MEDPSIQKNGAGAEICGLARRFREQAERTPDAVAVMAGGTEITYRELREQVDRLACHLVALGVGPEVTVGICLEPSPLLIRALLAILEAGGAYLPLDPGHPAGRLGILLDEVEPLTVLTDSLHAGLVLQAGGRVLRIDEEPKPGTLPSGALRRSPALPDNLAYVLYTSGSTGRPKGVAVTRGSLDRYLRWVEETLLPGLDFLPWVTPLTFDAHLKQVFAPLRTGRPVWIVPPEVMAEPAALLAGLAGRERVGLNCVPSVWTAILAEMEPAQAAALNGRLVRLLLGGERLSEELVATTRAVLPEIEICNLYGPTEATSNTSMARVIAGDVSLGRPAAGARLAVLDPALETVPTGNPGELCIGGGGLARGYFGRPDLTAERFLPDPLAGEPGARLYRTGDLVAERPDGTLAFLGRIDLQVKIQGVRIEIEEIEAALFRHPKVREAAIALRDVENGPRLAAWVVLDEPAPSAGEIRSFLRSLLPGPMVPASFLRVGALPRTAAGKLDRGALAALDAGGEEGPDILQTPVEEILAGVWSRLLGRERIGADDDFFSLGGHSLQAIRMAAATREIFGVELPLRALFERPTLAGVAMLVEEARRGEEDTAPPIRRIDRSSPLPLSFSQLRQWFLVQMEPGTSAYNIPLALRLRGVLDVRRLELALGEILRRQEILRTTFAGPGREPVQVVGPAWDVNLPVVDLGESPEGEFEGLIRRVLRCPLDPCGGPLWRAFLFRRSNEEHVLLFVLHHIISDGWSLGVITSELASAYSGPAPLPELPVQYGDYAVWQRRWLQGEVLEREIAHWRSRLAGAPGQLPLATDRPRPAVQSFRGAAVPLELPSGVGRALRDLGARERGTLFMVLAGAFAVLLHRATGEEEICLGTFAANRRWKEIEALVGLFVNTLVLRLDLGGTPAFSELLARLREVTLDAFEHQDLPFEKLLEALEPSRDPSRTPFFQAMVVLQNYPLAPQRLPGLEIFPFDVEGEEVRSHCDLTLWAWEAGDDLAGSIEYNSDLFDRASIVRMALQLRNLLSALASGDQSGLSRLPLMPESERHQILHEWGRGEVVAEVPALVHELLLRQAELRPSAPAVIADPETLSYAGLAQRVIRLARRLRRHGVGLGSVVGLHCPRSLEAVIGIFAILRAGGAYLPLEPGLPTERLALLARDSGVSVLLTVEPRPSSFPDFDGQVVCLSGEGDGEGAGLEESIDLPVRVPPEVGAYLFYTSGTTGVPKGVLIPQGVLATFIETARNLFEIVPQDRVLQFSSLSFDISVEEIFSCLTSGATLVLRTDEMLASPSRFLQTCAAWGVTVLDLPTAYWHELTVELGRGEVSLPTSVRLVIIAGERALQSRLDDWRRSVAGRARLLNTYGPTEATASTTAYDPEKPGAAGSTNGVSIGRPIRGAEVYVLDRELGPAPVGMAGELHIGGVGLARGYHGRPDLTAERFLPSPFTAKPGERLYRTGDLVRWLPDGNLEFLGRVDDQVKIRGFRVEPGEIAAVLCLHPIVREAVVLPYRDARGEMRLAAYAAASGVAPGELRQHLKAKLPAYMVPASLVVLETLPLTPVGKLDRRALPPPNIGVEAEEILPPGSELEERLVEIWRDLLGIGSFGVHESFFDLGGHSLLVPQLLSHIQDAFQVEVPLRALFEAPTVARLALVIEDLLLDQIESLTDEEVLGLSGEGDGDNEREVA